MGRGGQRFPKVGIRIAVMQKFNASIIAGRARGIGIDCWHCFPPQGFGLAPKEAYSFSLDNTCEMV